MNLRCCQAVEETYALIRDLVRQHKETFDEDNLRDFVDVYLKEMRGGAGAGAGAGAGFTEEELLVVAMDMFTAGSETTSTTLAWAVCYMITQPGVQTRVQEEIDRVLGDRAPALEDRAQLSYTEATIMEIQRVAAIAPMAVPHRAMEDITIRGHKIPANTVIWCILYHIMRDPDYWTDPDTFNPDRFLDAEGKVVKEERFVPYGIGMQKNTWLTV